MKNKSLFIVLAAFFSLSSCSTWFENRIPMNIKDSGSSLSALVAPAKKKEKLDAPAQIYTTVAGYSDRIIVNWTPVEGATSYYIERAVSVMDENGNYKIPEDSEYDTLPFCQRYYSTSYEDIILSEPVYSAKEYTYKYYYRVCADNPREGYKSSDFTVSSGGTLLAPPKSVSASLGESKEFIEITWTAVNGARSYDIYRSTNKDGSNSRKIGFVTGNERRFINKVTKEEQGKDFYYTVCSVSSTGKSVPSSLTLGYSLVDGACGAVTGVEVLNGDAKSLSEINIKWNPLDYDGEGMLQYAVYRSSSEDSTLVLLAELNDETTYKDTKDLKPGVFYYYQIQGFVENTDDSGNLIRVKGPFSKSGAESSAPAEGYLLSAPARAKVVMNKEDKTKCQVLFTAAIGSPRCSLVSKVNNTKDYSYKLYSSNERNGVYDLVGEYSGSTLDQYFNEESKMYEIPDLETKNFYYIQTAIGDLISNPGEVFASAPLEVRNLVATKAEFIDGLTNDNSMANEFGVFSTVISWEPSSSNDADGGYRIFRSEKKDSGWRKIGEVSKETLQFIDNVKDTNEGAKPGVVFYYRVLSLNADMEGDNYSAVAAGYGAITPEQYMKIYNVTVKESHKKIPQMQKSGMEHLGEATGYGNISGNLYYYAKLGSGMRGDVTMKYTDYADFYMDEQNQELGPIFILNGNSDTNSSLSDGYMRGTVNCTGMYPGAVGYDNIKIVQQKCGGGTYKISRQGFEDVDIDWSVGED